jgi:hypothetical protein
LATSLVSYEAFRDAITVGGGDHEGRFGGRGLGTIGKQRQGRGGKKHDSTHSEHGKCAAHRRPLCLNSCHYVTSVREQSSNALKLNPFHAGVQIQHDYQFGNLDGFGLKRH